MLLLNKSGKADKSLRSHLIGPVLGAVLPILLFAGGLIAYLAYEQTNHPHINFTNILLVAIIFMILSLALGVFLGRRFLTSLITNADLEKIRSENTFKTLYEISSSLSGELDLKKLLQSFTDQTTVLTRAEFGVYFENNEFRDIVTKSGKEIENNPILPLPHSIHTLIRFDDITHDNRYRSHPMIRSYLSVPVVSRTGEVLGGLIFGHSKPNIFTAQDEKLIGALAAHAAMAIDNASLYSKATQAIELRDTFLSVASHELKTPLTSIYLQFEILKRRTMHSTENDPKVIYLLERFESQLERLTRLINELLDVTRIASGKMSLHPENIQLEKLVRDICANFEIEALQNGTPITLKIKHSVNGLWDVNRIEQVVMNLLSNAIKYGNKNPIEVTVSKNDNWALIQILDQGLGIATKDQRRIFQRFERAIDSFTISGLGLGLYICKEIILRHGGDINVESALGKGSTFTLRLPLTSQK